MRTRTTLALALGALFAANAQAIWISPNGTGAGDAVDVSVLGWGNGNVLVLPLTGGSATDLALHDVLQVFGHAGLANFQNDDGQNITPSTFVQNSWTYVLGFEETVSSVEGTPPGGTANFLTTSNHDDSLNFFEIYYDPDPDFNNLSGTGFALDGYGDGDRVLIYSGTIRDFAGPGTPGSGNFTGVECDPDTQNCALDQTGANNYNGTGDSTDIQSIHGTGSGQFVVDTAFAHEDFFIGVAPAFLTLSFNYFTNLPFTEVNPSSCFWNGSALTGGAGQNSTGSGDAACLNTIGDFNGVDGPNLQLMTRASSAFQLQQVPEPGVLALLGIGLAGLAGFARRRSV